MQLELYNKLTHLESYVGCFYDIDGRRINVNGVFGGELYCFFLCEWDDTKEIFCIEPYEVITMVDHPFVSY